MHKHLYLSIFSAFLLTACSSNGPLFHSFGSYNEKDQTQGVYLLEEPYQIKDVWYFPAEQYDYSEEGLASWYIPAGDSHLTANGEVYEANVFSARHKTLPLPTIVRITNLENNKSIVARINDRGPMVNNRLVDVSQAAAKELEMPMSGSIMVKVEVLAEESKVAKEKLMGQGQVKEVKETQIEENDNLTLIDPEKVETPQAIIPTEAEVIYKPEDHYLPELKKEPLPVMGDTKIALGSFANETNAKNLQAKLSSQYPVSIESVQRNGRTFNVVKVGPYTKTEAQNLLKQLKQEGYPDAYLAQ